MSPTHHLFATSPRPHVSFPAPFTWESPHNTLSLTPSLSPTLSLYSWPWESSPPLPPLKPPDLAGGSPEHDAGELHRLNLISLELLQQASSSSPSPSSSSKQKDELELHQALTTIFKTLLVLHWSPLSSSLRPIYPHCPRLEPIEPLSPWMT